MTFTRRRQDTDHPAEKRNYNGHFRRDRQPDGIDSIGKPPTKLYDNENRLKGVLLPAGTRSNYAFDGEGLRRSAFEAGGALTTTIWDGTDYLMEKS